MKRGTLLVIGICSSLSMTPVVAGDSGGKTALGSAQNRNEHPIAKLSESGPIVNPIALRRLTGTAWPSSW